MKKTLVFIFLSLIFLCGCWDKTEVDDLAIITAIGIDTKGKDRYEVTLQLAKPEAFGKGETGYQGKDGFIIVNNEGKTISEAMLKFYTSSPRRVYWGHNKLIVFGKKISEKGIKDVLDWVERVEGLRFSTHIFTTPNTAKEVLSVNYTLEKIPSLAMQSNIRIRYKYLAEYTPTINTFIDRMFSHNKVSYATNLGKVENNLEILGIGVFKDGRLIYTLNNEQTQDIMRLFNRVKGGLILAPCKKNPKKYTSFEIHKEKSSLTPEIKGKKLVYHLKIDVQGILDSTQCGEKILKKPKIREMEKEISKVIEKRVRSVINISQKKLKTDILHFDDYLRMKKPRQWPKFEKKWDKIFPTIETKIEVNTTIKRSAWVKDPIPRN